ncbi:MAG TPA: lamin tail domain-containing protein, partial [Candidatus Woesebacteria bacterium]|nr:lamin tail domain-containing protein [Candidatus Woesebacteria bacterium]
MLFPALLIVILLFTSVNSALAQVKISDFCADCDPEWVDLINVGTSSVSLDQWNLLNRNGYKLPLSGIINSNEVLRFIKTKGWLNNEEGKIILINGIGETIDQIAYPTPTPIPIPTNTPIPSPLSTATPTPIPTPILTPTTILVPTNTLIPTLTPTPLPPPVDHLYLNEIMPYPETGSEWVEIFNDNDFEINLENYKIKDNSSRYRLIVGDNPVLAHSYFVFLFANYLNNDGDSLSLFDPFNRQIGESFSYTTAKKGLSYSWQENNSWCLSFSSMNQDNNSCYTEPTAVPTPTHTPKPTATP